MTPAPDGDEADPAEARPVTLVWIDAAVAVIVRWQDDRARLERLESEVPAHHRTTGHVRHDPCVRHGGGHGSQTAGEPHRLEHLRQFVAVVASRLPPGDDLLVLGPGTVHERLARQLTQADRHHGRHRDVACQTSPPLTDRQLIARLRRRSGAGPRRRTVGAYRWSEPAPHGPSGRAIAGPRRVSGKPSRDRVQPAPDD